MIRRVARGASVVAVSAAAAWTTHTVVPAATDGRLVEQAAVVAPRVVPASPGPTTVPAPTPEHPWQVAGASWYGPGFYGHGTKCGQRYGPDLYGVAHKQLPCGTLIDFEWMGTVFRDVPVVDRGPYVRGRTWDLTQEACEVMQYETGVGRCHTGAIAWRLAA